MKKPITGSMRAVTVMAAITPGLGCLCETGIVDAEDSDGRGVSLVGELEDVAVVGSEATCMQAMRRMINTRWRSALMHSLSAISGTC